MQETAQKLAAKADSAVTYCAGGGLAGFSCFAAQLQPILAVAGGVVGILVCLAKGYYDFKNFRDPARRYKSRPTNDR